MVLEAIPGSVGQRGFGTARHPDHRHRGIEARCAGQVLVLHDMLDIAPGARPASSEFHGQPASVAAAIAAYVTAVGTAASRQPNTATGPAHSSDTERTENTVSPE